MSFINKQRKKEIYHIKKPQVELAGLRIPYSSSTLCGVISDNVVSSRNPESLAKLEKGFNGFARYCHRCRAIAGVASEAVGRTTRKA